MSDYLNGLARRARLGNVYRKAILLFLTDKADDLTGETSPASLSYISFGLEIGLSSVKKYRRELKTELQLIEWIAAPGPRGSAVYTIDVAKLKFLADQAALEYSLLIGREATNQIEKVAARLIDRSRGDQITPETSREATITPSNKQQTNKRDNRICFR